MKEEIKEADLTNSIQLLDFVTTVTEIKCDECNTIDKSYMDEWEAIETFIDRGWEVKKDKVLCEKCIEKLGKK